MTVAVLPGDGIGPEVVAEGPRVLRTVAERWGHEITLREGLIGGCAIDARGSALPFRALDRSSIRSPMTASEIPGRGWSYSDRAGETDASPVAGHRASQRTAAREVTDV